MIRRIYIAGPMTGYHEWNFPAFHRAEGDLRRIMPDAEVANPARHFNGRTDLPYEVYIKHAVQALMASTEICMLPGWERSLGAKAELAVAEALRMPVIFAWHAVLGKRYQDRSEDRYMLFDPDSGRAYTFFEATEEVSSGPVPKPIDDAHVAETFGPLGIPLSAKAPDEPPKSYLETIRRLTNASDGDRNSDYGHPLDNFNQIAALWEVLKPEVEFSAEDVALFNIAQKMSRLSHADKEDSWIDIGGYAECMAIVKHERWRREQAGLARCILPDDEA